MSDIWVQIRTANLRIGTLEFERDVLAETHSTPPSVVAELVAQALETIAADVRRMFSGEAE